MSREVSRDVGTDVSRDVTEDREVPAPRRQLPWSTQLMTGLAVGAVLGVAARIFMRLLTDDPEFTWNGTLFVVGIFTVFGLVQSGVALVRSRSTDRRVTVPTRLVGGGSYLLLGGGAGIVMIPFLWCGALAMWRTDWHRSVRSVLAAIAAIDLVALIVIHATDVPFEPEHLLGYPLLLAIYLGSAWTAGPTLR